ncbi:MAG: hypothetical protein CMJ65_00330 [Planctomycetaceae bacterium]|nr:hypothetical protein [Planctomycetaceae bacterium]
MKGGCGVLLAVAIAWPIGCGEADRPKVPVRVAGESLTRPLDDTATPADATAPAAVSPAEKSSKTAATRERKLTGIRFDVPTGWSEQAESEFYEAKYVIPSEHGEMTLTLTTMGGGIEANLNRWVGQFRLAPGEKPRRETLSVDGLKSEWIDVRGTFRSRVGNSPGPHSDWRLLGAAIPTKPRPFLLKLIGPRSAVAEFGEEFRKFVRSGRVDR